MIPVLNPHKKKVYEAREFLEETGQESEEKGRKVVQQYFKAEQLKELGQREYFLERLDNRRKYNDYNKLCAQITLFYLEEQDLPRNFIYKVQYDTKGVLLFLSFGKKIFQRAFRAVREPLYDLNACQVFAFSVGDIISKHGVKHGNGRTLKSQQA